MSSAAGSVGRGTPEWDRLELAARRLLQEHQACRRRAESAEARIAQLEAALQRLSSGTLDPLELQGRLQRAESQNEALRVRLQEAEAHVQRILAKLEFAEEER